MQIYDDDDLAWSKVTPVATEAEDAVPSSARIDKSYERSRTSVHQEQKYVTGGNESDESYGDVMVVNDNTSTGKHSSYTNTSIQKISNGDDDSSQNSGMSGFAYLRNASQQKQMRRNSSRDANFTANSDRRTSQHTSSVKKLHSASSGSDLLANVEMAGIDDS